MAIAAIDVYYYSNQARAACIVFNTWSSDTANQVYAREISGVEPYQPGEFYKRELPPVLKILELVNLSTGRSIDY
jgi:deoxyribonuclease V